MYVFFAYLCTSCIKLMVDLPACGMSRCDRTGKRATSANPGRPFAESMLFAIPPMFLRIFPLFFIIFVSFSLPRWLFCNLCPQECQRLRFRRPFIVITLSRRKLEARRISPEQCKLTGRFTTSWPRRLPRYVHFVPTASTGGVRAVENLRSALTRDSMASVSGNPVLVLFIKLFSRITPSLVD